jgi:hypothetical protein
MKGCKALAAGSEDLFPCSQASAIVYEYDRRNKLMEDGLGEPAIYPTDKKAMAIEKE